jgi:hypothetical protein
MSNSFLAAQIQSMAEKQPNEKLALAMNILSVVMIGTIAFRELSHCYQEQLRSHDRRHRGRESPE